MASEKVTFVTTAYGDFYREFALKGLINSFIKFNPNEKLHVYIDAPISWPVPKNVTLINLDKALIIKMTSPTSTFFERTSFKFEILKQSHIRTQNGVCWIDADSLVLSRLSSQLNLNNICVMRHGSCPDDEVFDCGKGLIVNGTKFAVGGVFYLPTIEDINFLIKLADERATWSKDEKAYWYSDGEQSLLNHLIHEEDNSKRVSWMDDSGNIFNWDFLSGRHPYPFDLNLTKITTSNDAFFYKERKFSILSWSSLTLREHKKLGFKTFNSDVKNILRKDYYKITSNFKSVLRENIYYLICLTRKLLLK